MDPLDERPVLANYAMAMTVFLSLTMLTDAAIVYVYIGNYELLRDGVYAFTHMMVSLMYVGFTVLATYLMCDHSKKGYLLMVFLCLANLFETVVVTNYLGNHLIEYVHALLTVVCLIMLLNRNVCGYYLKGEQ